MQLGRKIQNSRMLLLSSLFYLADLIRELVKDFEIINNVNLNKSDSSKFPRLM